MRDKQWWFRAVAILSLGVALLHLLNWVRYEDSKYAAQMIIPLFAAAALWWRSNHLEESKNPKRKRDERE